MNIAKAKWIRYAVAMTVLVATPAIVCGQTYRIDGVVIQQDTAFPAPHVVVHAVSLERVGPKQAPVFGFARTGNDGVFSIRVPSGRYRLCVTAADVYLDPCAWPDHSNRYETVSLATAGQPLRIVLSKGRRVHVRLRGTSVELANEAGREIPPLRVRVVGGPGSVSREIPLTGRTDSFVDFNTVIPQDPSLRISVASEKLQLTRQDGARLTPALNLLDIPAPSPAASLPPPLKSRNQKPESVLVLNITGRTQ
jgi:hypothetical protein